MHSCVISSDTKAHIGMLRTQEYNQQFYCVSCGGINNLIWIFSLYFDIRFIMGKTHIEFTVKLCERF